MRMRPVMLSPVDCPVAPYFPTLSHKRNHFRKKSIIEYKMWFSIYNFCLIHSSLWEELNEILSHTYRSAAACVVPLLLSDFNETWIFSTEFREKIFKYQILWKSVQYFHADGQTETHRHYYYLAVCTMFPHLPAPI